MTPSHLTSEQGAELTRWARESIREALGGPKARAPRGAWCDEPGATFVTLRQPNGDLHGCIGSLEPRRSLSADVRANAVAAALDDPRAPVIALEDVDRLELELSVLSKLERVSAKDEAEAIAKLAGLRDGVVLRHRGRRATFLPQMWEHFPDAAELLAQLKHKAGFAEDFWDPEIEVLHYTVDKF